jgi:hypothetical protein
MAPPPTTPTPPPSSSPDDTDPRDAWLARLDASIDGAGKPRATAQPIEPILYPPPHPAQMQPELLLRQCTMTKGRTGGPGGQHRNKVETLVRLTHTPTAISGRASERRSAAENHGVALERLRLHLAVLVRCPVVSGDSRSELWRSRSGAARSGRIAVNPHHPDFPSMLAEALDVLWAMDLEPKAAALRLTCTTSQLVKLVKEHGPALVWLNAHRVARGQHALK